MKIDKNLSWVSGKSDKIHVFARNDNLVQVMLSKTNWSAAPGRLAYKLPEGNLPINYLLILDNNGNFQHFFRHISLFYQVNISPNTCIHLWKCFSISPSTI